MLIKCIPVFTLSNIALYVFVRFANILCRCSAVHFVCTWCARRAVRRYSLSTRPPQLYLFPYRFILLGNLCWLIMANTVEIISATRRDYIFCIHKWFRVYISRLVQFHTHTHNTEDDFPTTNYISRILLLCLCLVVLIALRMYFVFIYITGAYIWEFV